MDINKNTPVENLLEILPHKLMPRDDRSNYGDWKSWKNINQAFKQLMRNRIDTIPPYPKDKYRGRGVVICAGGERLFTNGWVCARILRHLGCNLPIEFWHRNYEIDRHMKKLVEPYNITCHDGDLVKERERIRYMAGWELKPLAMLYSSFKEVLLLDADNVSVQNPTFLFETNAYRDTGALFWPDYGKLAPDRPIWDVCETDYRDYPNQHEFESGQIVVDKERHWKAMLLTMFMNEYSDYYYQFIHGDKCTFEMAWKRLRAPYFLIQRTIHSLDATMCQHSPIDGSRLFQHRNMDKWMLNNKNRKIRDFWLEDTCREFIDELSKVWKGKPFQEEEADGVVDEEVIREANDFSGKTYVYNRVGYDRREIEMLPGGKIGKGAGGCEQRWKIHRINGELVLTIYGTTPTCNLKKEDGMWVGRWLHHERMFVEIYPMKRMVKLL